MPCRFLVIFALLLSLVACGAGDNAMPVPSSNASANTASDSAAVDASAAAPGAASDPVSSAQASLDADNRQVTPVLSYAPDSEDTSRR
jgi:hypothetical protein